MEGGLPSNPIILDDDGDEVGEEVIEEIDESTDSHDELTAEGYPTENDEVFAEEEAEVVKDIPSDDHEATFVSEVTDSKGLTDSTLPEEAELLEENSVLVQDSRDLHEAQESMEEQYDIQADQLEGLEVQEEYYDYADHEHVLEHGDDDGVDGQVLAEHEEDALENADVIGEENQYELVGESDLLHDAEVPLVEEEYLPLDGEVEHVEEMDETKVVLEVTPTELAYTSTEADTPMQVHDELHHALIDPVVEKENMVTDNGKRELEATTSPGIRLTYVGPMKRIKV
jgi:hypothetical protein